MKLEILILNAESEANENLSSLIFFGSALIWSSEGACRVWKKKLPHRNAKNMYILRLFSIKRSVLFFKKSNELSHCATEKAYSTRSEKKWILWIFILNLQVYKKENISKPKNSIHLWSMELIDIIQHTEHLLLNMTIGKKRYLKSY